LFNQIYKNGGVVFVSIFLEKFQKSKKGKNSILCIGLDPATARLREKNVIPAERLKDKEENDAKLDFCLDLLEKVSDFACAAKPNMQYVMDFTKQQHQKLNKAIHDKGMFSILDHKLGDIGASNQSGMFNIKEFGYDAITYNPFSGNIEEVMKFAGQYGLGIIVLTLMSNPEAVFFMKEASIQGKPGYMFIAEKIKEFRADGAVIGTTGHVTIEEIKQIRQTIGQDKLILFPGVGAQGGDAAKVIEAGGDNIIINVGRAVMYADKPGKAAKEYNDLFNSMRK